MAFRKKHSFGTCLQLGFEIVLFFASTELCPAAETVNKRLLPLLHRKTLRHLNDAFVSAMGRRFADKKYPSVSTRNLGWAPNLLFFGTPQAAARTLNLSEVGWFGGLRWFLRRLSNWNYTPLLTHLKVNYANLIHHQIIETAWHIIK